MSYFFIICSLSFSFILNPLYSLVYDYSTGQTLAIKNKGDISSYFPITPEEIERSFQSVKSYTLASTHYISHIPPKERTFENTVLEYDKTVAYFRIYGSAIVTLNMVHPDENIRLKTDEILKKWTDCLIDLLETNPDIYRSFKEFQSTNQETLNDERHYYFTHAMNAFRRAGLELETQQFLELKKLQKKIALLSIQFHTNITQDKSFLYLNREDLLGIEEEFIKV